MPAARPAAVWNTAGAVAAVWGGLFLATIAVYARGSLPVVLLGLIADGGGAAIWAASAGLGGAVLLRRLKARCAPALFAATACGLGLGIYSLLLLGLALAGWLTVWTTLALPALSAGVYTVETLRRRPAWLATGRIDLGLSRPAGGAWVLLLAAIPAGMAATAGGILPGVLWKPADPHPYDVVEYHLELPREWYEAGRMRRPTNNIYGYFPAVAEVQSLAAMELRGGPWAGMYQAQYLSLIYAILTVMAVCGATRSPAAGVMAAAVPWAVMLAGVAYNESAFLLYATLAAAWAVRALRGRAARCMAVAGAAAGFACGVKYTAVPMVLIGVAVAYAAAPGRGKWRLKVVPLAVYGLAAVALLSPWGVRNLAWAGNPVYPLAVRQFGSNGLSDGQVERWDVAHAPPAAEASAAARAAAFGNIVLLDPQYGRVIWPLALIAAAVGLAAKRSRPGAVLLVTLLGTMAVVWVGFTHLQGRFFTPAIPVAALLIGGARGRLARGLTTAGAAAAILTGVLFVGPQLETFAALGRAGFFGVTDLSFIPPPGLAAAAAAADPSRPVALVGDARAFLYQLPLSRLHYRTVFDLPADAPDAVTAWSDPALKDPILVIDPPEVARLHATYRHVPPLSPSVPGPRDRPFVVTDYRQTSDATD